MSSKIKVDPKTFKIINQEKSIESKTDSDSFTSDSDSLTSVNSDTDSVKVIKLDDSLQSGGKGYQYQQQLPPKISSLNSSTFTNNTNLQPKLTSQSLSQPLSQPSSQPLSQPSSQPSQPSSQQSSQPSSQPPPLQPLSEQKSMEERYLRTTSESTNNSNNNEQSVSESSIAETDINEEGKEEITTENPTVESNGSTDVIDLTKNQLHEILYSIFTDGTGDNISENILKMSKLFEKHNEIMEKILNQLIIMNTNYKQVTVPETIQTNTKQAKTLNDFRKNTQKLENN